jgi:hypothetical protein
MIYNNATGLVSPGTVESPVEDDDDAEMMKSRTKKSSRAPFRFKQLSIMKSGSFKLKQMSPQPTELASSPVDDKPTFERQKSATGSTRSSRLKKLFMLSRADPSRKRPKDISLRNLRHVLWQNASLVVALWPAIGNVEQVIMEIRGSRGELSDRENCHEGVSVEMGMKTAETQTELIDASSVNSPEISEGTTSNNNHEVRLNINSLRDINDLKCIDDDTDESATHRINFIPDNPETKL